MASLEGWTNYECGCAGGPGDPLYCQECFPNEDIKGKTVLVNGEIWVIQDPTFHSGQYVWLERPEEDGKGNVAIIRPVATVRRALELQSEEGENGSGSSASSE